MADGAELAATPAAGSFNLLGTRVHALQIPDVIRTMEHWIAARDRARYVVVANVHVIMEGHLDAQYRRALDGADLCIPDGKPLVWVGRMHGHALRRRCYGPDLLVDFCRATETKGYRHFFYGGAEGVAEQLATQLQARFPALQIAGTYSPPFRQLTQEEDAAVIDRIHRAAPDVLWIGLGCPKQEIWMKAHRELRVPVMLGVGQAFDIHAGRIRQAPAWMRERGLEWLFRLASEPRRLWRRYLVYNTQFLFYLCLQHLGIRREN